MSSEKKSVLGDHHREGKVFKPPMSQLGVFEETSWTETTMPELLWIGLVFDSYDTPRAIELALSLAEISEERYTGAEGPVFAFASSYAALGKAEQDSVRKHLSEEEVMLLRNALETLICFYPECPLDFLFESKPSAVDLDTGSLERFKKFVASLYDKRGRAAVFMQAQAVYILGMAGRLFIKEGLSLGDLNELRSYPETRESKKVGASVCAACNMLVRMSHSEHDSNWSDYFWARGFELENCQYDLPYEI